MLLAPIEETIMKSSDTHALAAGIAATGAILASASTAGAAVKPKSAGETKIVALFGSTERSSGIGHEIQIRGIFESKKDWRLVFVRSNRLFTPDLIRDADLFIVGRDAGPDPSIFSRRTPASRIPSPQAHRSGPTPMSMRSWTTCRTAAWASSPCRARRSAAPPFATFLDVAGIEPHAIEPMWYTRFDKTHPVVSGVGKFSVLHDEQPLVIIKSPTTATLFESTADHEKRQGVSGWALERGKGRIAGLLPGSTTHAYLVPEYRTIIWRAAHWAMKRDIPPCPGENNRYYV